MELLGPLTGPPRRRDMEPAAAAAVSKAELSKSGSGFGDVGFQEA